MKACIADFGNIDVLDNNVGIAEIGGVVEMSEETWDKVLDVNLKSAFLTMKHVIPIMVVQGGGSIINISSVAAIRYTGVPYATYYASKAALSHLSRTTAVEYASKGVRVNTILPGLMQTPMVEHSAGLAKSYAGGNVEEMWKKRAAQVPMGIGGSGLGHRVGRGVPRERREPLHHRHRSGGRWRADAEGELIPLVIPEAVADGYPGSIIPSRGLWIPALAMRVADARRAYGSAGMTEPSYGHCAPLSIQACASSPSCC